MSDTITIDSNGASHNGLGLKAGGGQFITPLSGEQPAAVRLARHNLAIDLSGFPVGTVETDVGFAALQLGERVATVSGNLVDGVNVTVENPFDNGTLSYIRGGRTDYEVALTEATVSAAIAERLVTSDPELAKSISSLRYLDDSNTIAVHLKESDTVPARLMVIDLPAGTVTVHAADAVGPRISDPEWCIEHMAGPSAVHGVAANLVDVIQIEAGSRWTAEEHDGQTTNEFVSRVLAPLMKMSALELGHGTKVSEAVANEKMPAIVFSGFRHPSVGDEEHADSAVQDLTAQLANLSASPHIDTEFQAGEVRGFATAFAAVRLADTNPTLAQFEAERDTVVNLIRSNVKGLSLGTGFTVSRIEQATGLMLKSLQHDLHTKTPDRVELVAADIVLSALDSLGSTGLFTGGRAPAGAASRIIAGMPLSDHRLFENNSDDLEPFNAPRRKPVFGIWE